MKGRTRSAVPDLGSGTSGCLWEPLKWPLKSGMHVGICCFFFFFFLKRVSWLSSVFQRGPWPWMIIKLPHYLPILLVRALWPGPEQQLWREAFTGRVVAWCGGGKERSLWDWAGPPTGCPLSGGPFTSQPILTMGPGLAGRGWAVDTSAVTVGV